MNAKRLATLTVNTTPEHIASYLLADGFPDDTNDVYAPLQPGDAPMAMVSSFTSNGSGTTMTAV